MTDDAVNRARAEIGRRVEAFAEELHAVGLAVTVEWRPHHDGEPDVTIRVGLPTDT